MEFPIPQHAVFRFDDIEISSDFDSGNIANAEMNEDKWFSLWTGPDGIDFSGENSYRTWFYFKVTTNAIASMKFTIKNLNIQSKLFKEGMKPVYRTENTDWERLLCEIQTVKNGKNFEITFEHNFTETCTYFAFTYPWSYSQHLEMIKELNSVCDLASIYFCAENMINSLEKRRCHILTISSYAKIQENKEKKLENLFPDNEPRCAEFSGKKIIFISARVHPGEIPSSHVLNGFLKFITSNDCRAVILRDMFVFKVIPILNPDGVFRGYYRTDTNGANLNRFYTSPSISEHPTIYAAKELFNYYQSVNEVFLYIDLHAHASKKGCFVYGNHLDFNEQIENCLFPKIMSINCINFDFVGSNFTESNMKTSDKRDGLSKEGSGRVAFYKQTKIVYCYTLECNYNTGKTINTIISPEDEVTDNECSLYSYGPPKYTVKIYEDVGKAIAISALDLTEKNPDSRVSNYKDLRLEVAAYIATIIPYRFDPEIKKASKSKEDLENYINKRSNEEKKKPLMSEKNPGFRKNRYDSKRNEFYEKDNFVVTKEEKRNNSVSNQTHSHQFCESYNEQLKDSQMRKCEGIICNDDVSDSKSESIAQDEKVSPAQEKKDLDCMIGRSVDMQNDQDIIVDSSSLNSKSYDS